MGSEYHCKVTPEVAIDCLNGTIRDSQRVFKAFSKESTATPFLLRTQCGDTRMDWSKLSQNYTLTHTDLPEATNRPPSYYSSPHASIRVHARSQRPSYPRPTLPVVTCICPVVGDGQVARGPGADASVEPKCHVDGWEGRKARLACKFFLIEIQDQWMWTPCDPASSLA